MPSNSLAISNFGKVLKRLIGAGMARKPLLYQIDCNQQV